MNSQDIKIIKYQAKIVKEKLKKAILSKDHKILRTLTYYFYKENINPGKYDNNERKLSKENFLDGLFNLDIHLEKDEIDTFFMFYDKENNNYINFDNFLIEIRGELDKERKEILEKIFQLLDNNKEEKVKTNKIFNNYDISFHPKRNEISKEDLIKDFLFNFRLDGNLNR